MYQLRKRSRVRILPLLHQDTPSLLILPHQGGDQGEREFSPAPQDYTLSLILSGTLKGLPLSGFAASGLRNGRGQKKDGLLAMGETRGEKGYPLSGFAASGIYNGANEIVLNY
jgi:hypothetical protein